MGKGYLVSHQKVSINVGLNGKLHVRMQSCGECVSDDTEMSTTIRAILS